MIATASANPLERTSYNPLLATTDAAPEDLDTKLLGMFRYMLDNAGVREDVREDIIACHTGLQTGRKLYQINGTAASYDRHDEDGYVNFTDDEDGRDLDEDRAYGLERKNYPGAEIAVQLFYQTRQALQENSRPYH